VEIDARRDRSSSGSGLDAKACGGCSAGAGAASPVGEEAALGSARSCFEALAAPDRLRPAKASKASSESWGSCASVTCGSTARPDAAACEEGRARSRSLDSSSDQSRVAFAGRLADNSCGSKFMRPNAQLPCVLVDAGGAQKRRSEITPRKSSPRPLQICRALAARSSYRLLKSAQWHSINAK